MSFKKILSGALAALVFVGEEHLCTFGRGHYGKPSCEVIFKFGLVVQDEMSFKEKDYQRMDARRTTGED